MIWYKICFYFCVRKAIHWLNNFNKLRSTFSLIDTVNKITIFFIFNSSRLVFPKQLQNSCPATENIKFSTQISPTLLSCTRALILDLRTLIRSGYWAVNETMTLTSENVSMIFWDSWAWVRIGWPFRKIKTARPFFKVIILGGVRYNVKILW